MKDMFLRKRRRNKGLKRKIGFDLGNWQEKKEVFNLVRKFMGFIEFIGVKNVLRRRVGQDIIIRTGVVWSISGDV